MRHLRDSFVVFMVTAAPMIWTVEPLSTVQYDVTTMAAANSTSADEDWQCNCDCAEVDAAINRSSNAPSTQDEAQKAANKLSQELTVDKSNLSSTTRRKNSAADNRTSAQSLGVVGIAVIVAVLGTIVALDLSVLSRDLRVAVCRLFGLTLPEGLHLVRRRAGYAKRARNFGRGLGVVDAKKSSCHHAAAAAAAAAHAQSQHSPPPAARVYRQDDTNATANSNNINAEHFDDVLERRGVVDTAEAEMPASGAGAVKALAQTPPPFPVTSSGLPPDIKSRRELLLMHGAPR